MLRKHRKFLCHRCNKNLTNSSNDTLGGVALFLERIDRSRVDELVPSLGKCFIQLALIFCKDFRNLQELIVVQKANVTRQAHDVSILTAAIFGLPLPMTAWTNMFFPLFVNQGPEEFIVPLCWFRCPWTFKTRCECVLAFASAARTWPRML